MNAKHRLVVLMLVIAAAVAAIVVLLTRQPAAKPPAESVVESRDPNVVARIGEYTIAKSDLVQRLVNEIRPSGEGYGAPKEPVTAKTVLLQMIAEKAMTMEGRKLGYLNEETIRPYIQQQRQRKLSEMAVMDCLRRDLSIADSEIDQAMKTNSQLTRDQAAQLVRRTKGTAVLEQYYKQLLEKFHVKLLTENYAKAAQIHDRLLLRPVTPRKESWILLSQMKTELSPEEKVIPLATYDGGRFTLLDLFQALHQMSPPSRPRDLGTPEGIGRFLDQAMKPAILVADAEARGFDKDPQLLREIRELEDRCLLGKVRTDKAMSTAEPTDEEIRAYFDKNKERFGESATLKVDQIWCKGLSAARKAKEMLDGGAGFEATKKACSEQKDSQPFNTYPAGEGPFWADLWKGEPNQVIGPMKGFFGEGLAWRLVRVIEKKPAQIKPYSDQVKDSVKWALIEERRNSVLDSYRKELLEKYPHELYADRIQDIDPLDIPEPNEVTK